MASTSVREGMLLWEPSEDFKQQANITRYTRWLASERGLHFNGYSDLWEWSVEHLEDFHQSLWEFYQVKASQPYTTVLEDRRMPGARWFVGAELNYAEHVFRQVSAEHPAVLFQSERHALTAVSWDEMRRQVAAVATALRAAGVGRGDRVVAYMPNIPQTLVAFLACASLGAIWSSCSPDFGTGSVIDRFAQIEPKVLFAIDGYAYGGKAFDRRAVVVELQRSLPTLVQTILVPYLNPESGTDGLARATLWADLLATTAEETLTFEQVPFDHPLWILYSSGTTGLPKPIVQGHGGILLEHLKALGLHLGLKPGDRFFWFTTTGWMMWNLLISAPLVGATILMYDGSPAYPSLDALWKFAADASMTVFGTSAGYITSCMKAGITPGVQHDLSKLVCLGSTGSPLPPEGFAWVYDQVKPDLWVASASGGTDVCSAFLNGCPILPVRAGELQCRELGSKVEAFDEQGRPLIGEVGELVITEPMPSMPLYFWNDPDGKRYRESYFEMYPGIWRHGDWIKITPEGSAIIYGRSDSTLNRMGVRIGTSDIYRVVEAIPEVLDSLVLGVEQRGGGYYMPLFVVLREGATLDDALRGTISHSLRTNLSPRHVPDEIIQIPEVPRTLNGKKLEVPIKKLLMGIPAERALNPDAVGNPQALQFFVDFARTRTGGTDSVLS
ncbi:MAG: acetoacetate--CoA ligase [Ktedonobacterales bacterium]